MKNDTVANLLETFSKNEKKVLAKFLESSFSQTRHDVRQRLDGKLKNENTALGSRRSAGAATFPEEILDEKQLRYLQSWSLQTLFSFLEWQEMQADFLQNRLYRCAALRKKGQETLFERELKSAFSDLESRPERDIAYFRTKSRLLQEKTKSAEVRRRSGELFLDELTTAFSLAAIAETLRHACTLLSHQAFSAKDYRFPLLEPVLKLVEDSPEIRAEPIVNAYFLIYKTQTAAQTEPFFQELKTLIEQRHAVFPAEEIRDIYLFVINFCIKKINAGEKAFVGEALKLYKIGLEKGFLLENGVLSPYAYNNIMLIALASGEVVWAENFLHSYRESLPAKNRENNFRFNLATFYFRTDRPELAMELLRDTEFHETLQKLDGQRMLIRIYYEKREFQVLDSLLDSFRTYLYRKDSVGYHRNNYLNLIKIMKKMLAADLKNAAEREKLLRETAKMPGLAEREWVREQLKRGALLHLPNTIFTKCPKSKSSSSKTK